MGNTSIKKVAADHPRPTGATSAPDLSKEMLKEWKKHAAVATAKKETPASPASATAVKTFAPPVLEASADEPFNSADDDQAVEDIVKEEGDEVMAAEDAARAPAPEPAQPKKHRMRKTILVLLLLLLIGVAVAMTFPSSRYFILNTVGVRSKASVVVIDSETRLPLKNVTVAIGNAKAATDSSGRATVKDIQLGEHALVIKRVAFAAIEENVTIGWGSNPLGEFLLKATGVQYTIHAQDYISGAPIMNVEARSGEAVATAADDGTLTLTLDETDSNTISLTLSAAAYRSETVVFDATTQKPIDVRMVPAAKEVFVVRQNGRYDLVSMFVDGKDQKVILPGTGSESANTSLAVDPSSAHAALVSHRDDLRGAQGQKVHTLRLVATDGSSSQVLARAEHITLVDWIGSTLIFQESNTTGNADDPERYKIISYDYATNRRVQLAAANQFNSVLVVKGMVYYAATGSDAKDTASYMRVSPDGTKRTTLVQGEVWTAVRTAYDRLLLQTPAGWKSYTTSEGLQDSSQPDTFTSRYYAEGPSQQSVWINGRDGKHTLMTHDNVSDKDAIIGVYDGMAYPIRWLTDTTLIVRVVTGNEAADYAIGLQGAVAKKITNVVNTYGINSR